MLGKAGKIGHASTLVAAFAVSTTLLAMTLSDPARRCESAGYTALVDVLQSLSQCPEGQSDCEPDDGEIVVDAVTVQERMRPDTMGPTVLPAGDTAGMRYAGLWGRPPDAVRRQFQLAALANDPDLKRRLLEPLSRDRDPNVRLRAQVELAGIAMRLGDPELALQHATAAPNGVTQPQMLADIRFLEAMAWSALGQDEATLTLLRTAIDLDPLFWNARLELMGASLRRLADDQLTANDCQRHLASLLETIAVLPTLADNTRYFRQIADYLASGDAPPSAAADYAAALAYAWTNDRARSLAALDRAAGALRELPRGCANVLLERLERDRRAIARLAAEEDVRP